MAEKTPMTTHNSESNKQLYLPRFQHGLTNMQSGIISLYERGWTVDRIAREFRITPELIISILVRFGYQ